MCQCDSKTDGLLLSKHVAVHLQLNEEKTNLMKIIVPLAHQAFQQLFEECKRKLAATLKQQCSQIKQTKALLSIDPAFLFISC